MRHDAPFIVMRLSPPVGSLVGRMLPRIAHRSYTAADAVCCAIRAQELARTAPPSRAWLRRASYWVERRGASACRRGAQR